ncbi:MAG TPA: aldo/keto reductase, partial [Candidatus Limnocylindrales bacterium]|nr:aldo/keto reductase [Candidatus Limnocylindrales bacterium]
MTPRRIADLSQYPIGLGAMPLSDPAMLAERPRSLATVHAALDSGVTLVDTADIYAPDGGHFVHNEVLVGEAVRSWAGSEAD